jgi:hypothetical protein
MRDLFSGPSPSRKPEPQIVRAVEQEIRGLRNRLTPRERVSSVTVVLATTGNLDQAIARALALTVEGEIVQVVLKECD